MKITVIGSGYVGTTAAAIFALSGHVIYAVDIDETKVEKINSGKAPFFETGLDNLVAAGVSHGNLKATTDYEEAVADADMVFSCVGTPDNPDGSSNLEYVHAAAKEAAKYLKPGAIYVQKSTVPVGTGREVMKHLPDSVSYVSNPEFLRESTAIYDTLFFDRVVAGSDDTEASEKILDLHRDVENHAQKIAALSGISGIDEVQLETHTGEYVTTSLESAELIKVTSNAFLALKITFANSIAKLADKTGADIDEVMSVVGSDSRIGRAFFNAGRGYGGGCFPKDVSGLIASSNSHGVDMPIMEVVQDVNSSMPGYIVDKLVDVFGDIDGKSIAVLGLAFKSGTSDARKSPSIKIANTLNERGALVTAYDPEANEEALHEGLSTNIKLVDGLNEAIDGSEVIVVATDWAEFTQLENWLDKSSASVIIDCMNALDSELIKSRGFQYVGVGRR